MERLLFAHLWLLQGPPLQGRIQGALRVLEHPSKIQRYAFYIISWFRGSTENWKAQTPLVHLSTPQQKPWIRPSTDSTQQAEAMRLASAVLPDKLELVLCIHSITICPIYFLDSGVNMFAMLTGNLPYTMEPFSIIDMYHKMMARKINPFPKRISQGRPSDLWFTFRKNFI